MLTWFNKQKHSYILWVGVILLFLGLYAFVNHLPFPRRVIPFIWGEQSIPFLPWTFVIYLSVFFQYFVVIHRIPRQALGILISRFLFVVAIALVFFAVFPTEYPRYLYPGNRFVELFRVTDNPGNCFPSLHVAETIFMAACYGFIEKTTWKKMMMWLWTILIILSVLTTKQHYLIDIFGGIALVIPFVFIARRDLSRQEILN